MKLFMFFKIFYGSQTQWDILRGILHQMFEVTQSKR